MCAWMKTILYDLMKITACATSNWENWAFLLKRLTKWDVKETPACSVWNKDMWDILTRREDSSGDTESKNLLLEQLYF